VTIDLSVSARYRPLQVEKGDTLIFQAWGQIWAGVWFTGNNGPNGWNNLDNDPKFPLPGTHPYCLLGKLDTRVLLRRFLRQDGQHAGPRHAVPPDQRRRAG
jgi:hypothetical protein